MDVDGVSFPQRSNRWTKSQGKPTTKPTYCCNHIGIIWDWRCKRSSRTDHCASCFSCPTAKFATSSSPTRTASFVSPKAYRCWKNSTGSKPSWPKPTTSPDSSPNCTLCSEKNCSFVFYTLIVFFVVFFSFATNRRHCKGRDIIHIRTRQSKSSVSLCVHKKK